MNKIYLVTEEYGDEDYTDFKVTPCATEEAAKKFFNEKVEADLEDHPADEEDAYVERTDTYYENYIDGYYNEGHSIIKIEVKDIIGG